MIVVMKQDATAADVNVVMERIRQAGLRPQLSQGSERTVVAVLGTPYPELKDALEVLQGVVEVVRISRPYKLASREFKPQDTVIDVRGVKIGGDNPCVIMAGPCAVESEKQIVETAMAVKAAGAVVLRGGAFKPRTSPYSFRGLGEQGLKFLSKARDETGLPVITEVMTVADVPLVYKHADILQVGARNMQNFNLLDEVGRTDKPILLKRGISGTIEEWLLAAEYILAQGNKQVMLCERGIRTYETYTRNTLDISAIPIIKKLSHLPIIADPSHGTGKWYLVSPMALAAVAAGAQGLEIEVHPTPDYAKSDGAQSLTFENFEFLMEQIRVLSAAVGKITRPIRTNVK